MDKIAEAYEFFDLERGVFFTREDIEAITGRKDPVLEMFRPANLDLSLPRPYHFSELVWPEELR